VTRVVFTEADMRARSFVKGLCRDAGLAVREDAIGNTFARWVGSEPELAPIGTGRTSMRFPMPARTTERWACWVVWRRSARCNARGFVRAARLNW